MLCEVLLAAAAAAAATTVSTGCHLGWLCVAATSPMPGFSLQLLSSVSVVVRFRPPDSHDDDDDDDDGDG